VLTEVDTSVKVDIDRFVPRGTSGTLGTNGTDGRGGTLGSRGLATPATPTRLSPIRMITNLFMSEIQNMVRQIVEMLLENLLMVRASSKIQFR